MGSAAYLAKEDEMGRPKGSKNKPRTPEGDPAHQAMHLMPGPDAPLPQYVPPMINPQAGPPAQITITLTEEDLEPARKAKAAHARAAAKYQRDEINSEIRRREIGEIEDLSVPQVQQFDLSGAFMKIAAKKARDAGYRFAHHLRKEGGSWVFEASNHRKETRDAQADQP